MLSGLRVGLEHVTREDILRFLEDDDFVSKLWSAVISRPFQFRMQYEVLKDRRQLIDEGVNKELLPLTTVLADRLKILSAEGKLPSD